MFSRHNTLLPSPLATWFLCRTVNNSHTPEGLRPSIYIQRFGCLFVFKFTSFLCSRLKLHFRQVNQPLGDRKNYRPDEHLSALDARRLHLNMNLHRFPPYPQSGEYKSSLRLATARDFNALATLEFLGRSQLFRYICPHHRVKRYMRDAADYLVQLTRFNLMDPRTVVIVVEDLVSRGPKGPLESTDRATLRKDSPPESKVVGMAVWRLPKDSNRIGQFSERDWDGTFAENLLFRGRDVDPERNRICSALMHAGCER